MSKICLDDLFLDFDATSRYKDLQDDVNCLPDEYNSLIPTWLLMNALPAFLMKRDSTCCMHWNAE